MAKSSTIQSSSALLYPLTFKIYLDNDEKQTDLCYVRTSAHQVKTKKRSDCDICSKEKNVFNLLPYAAHTKLKGNKEAIETTKKLGRYMGCLRHNNELSNFYPRVTDYGFVFSNVNHLPGHLLDELDYLPIDAFVWQETELKCVVIGKKEDEPFQNDRIIRKRKHDEQSEEIDEERKSLRLY